MAEGDTAFGGHRLPRVYFPFHTVVRLDETSMNWDFGTALSPDGTMSSTLPRTPAASPRGRGPHRNETYRDLLDNFMTPTTVRRLPEGTQTHRLPEGTQTVDLTGDDRAPRLVLQRTVSPMSAEGTTRRGPNAPARPAPVSRVRRRTQRREKPAASASPVIPSEHADSMRDEALVTRCKADLDRRFGIDVDEVHRLTAGIKRAKGEVLRDIGLAETRRANAETREAQLKEQVQLLVGATPSCEQGDDDECRAVHESLHAAVDGLTGAITAYRSSVRAQELTLKEQWALLQLLRHASGAGITGSAPTCGVCCAQQVARTAVPCGHSLCQGCMAKMADDRSATPACWYCRERIVDVMDIYFP